MDLHAYLAALALIAYGPVWLGVGFAIGKWGVPTILDRVRRR